jgi:hypothetical protein
MRGLLRLACRAFPPEHRARRSDEVVDTALLVADGSGLGTAREALSLVVAGLRQRVRAEADRPLRSGLTPLAWILAIVNLAVALAGAAAVDSLFLPFSSRAFPPYPYRPDWWWIAFTIAAAGVVLGLVRGDRRLALGAALANLGLLAYDTIFPARMGCPCVLSLIVYPQAFPARGQWLAPAAVLVIATAAAPLRRPPLSRLPLAFAAVLALVVVSQTSGHFYFLRWPLAAVLVLAIAFGALVPRLAVLAVGSVVAAAPSGASYLTGGNYHHHPSVLGFVATGLALGAFVPFARLVRRRVT